MDVKLDLSEELYPVTRLGRINLCDPRKFKNPKYIYRNKKEGTRLIRTDDKKIENGVELTRLVWTNKNCKNDIWVEL